MLPQLTRLDVEARARMEFPGAELADVLAVLYQYGREPHEGEVHRVHMALLKLSHGRMDLLVSAVKLANRDYRDVLAAAEYPAEMALRPLAADRSNAKEISQARRADREQYREWLGRG